MDGERPTFNPNRRWHGEYEEAQKRQFRLYDQIVGSPRFLTY